jgi:hypothetical protein
VEGDEDRGMTDGTNGTAVSFDVESIFEKYKEKKDRRRNKGRNHYAEFVSGAFETIQKFLAQGYSVNKVFQILVEERVFDINADSSTFYRVLRREKLRRGSGNSSTAAARKSVTKDEKAKEHERDGNYERNYERRVVSLNGRDVSIPVHVPDDLKSGRKERYSFSDYPKYIQEAFRESERKGTILQDREKNSRMVQEWIDRQGSENENGTTEQE